MNYLGDVSNKIGVYIEDYPFALILLSDLNDKERMLLASYIEQQVFLVIKDLYIEQRDYEIFYRMHCGNQKG